MHTSYCQNMPDTSELTGLNRTWGSAYLSARRTCRLGVLSAGRSAGRKYGLIRHPPLVLAEKTAGGTAVLPASRSAGRRYGRTFGRPARPAESPAVPSAGRSAGRKYGRTSGRPNRPAESTAVPPAGRVGRPKVRFNPSPPLVVIPPYTNNPPPPYILITGRLQWPQSAFCVHRLLCVPPCLWPL